MRERVTCAGLSRAAKEPLIGTASTVQRWILLEQPGPWGANAVLESRLPPPVATALRRLAGRLGARLLLIRRHGRLPRSRACFVAFTGRSERWIRRLDLHRPADLLDVDWTQFAKGRPVLGDTVDTPLYLVCTNGSHDACCAEHGKPLARALADAQGERLWESSHFGGDRFAGNLVCFPHGLYFGRVGAAEGPAVAAAYAAGRIALSHFRGRSCLPFDAQAAEGAIRQATGLDGVDDLRWQAREDLADGESRHVFTDSAGNPYAVAVSVTRAEESRCLSCSQAPSAPPRYTVRHLATEPPGL